MESIRRQARDGAKIGASHIQSPNPAMLEQIKGVGTTYAMVSILVGELRGIWRGKKSI